MNILKLGFKQTLKNTIATIILVIIPIACWNLILNLVGKALVGPTFFSIILVLVVLLSPIIAVVYLILLYKGLITTNIKAYSDVNVGFKRRLVFFGGLAILMACLNFIYFQVAELLMIGLGLFETLIELPKVGYIGISFLVLIGCVFVVVLFLASFYLSVANQSSIRKELVQLLNSSQLVERLVAENWLPMIIISALLSRSALLLMIGTLMTFTVGLMAPLTIVFSIPMMSGAVALYIASFGPALWFIIQLSSSVAKTILVESNGE